MKKRKTSRRSTQTTVWQALNEPIAYPSDEFARTVFLMTAVIMMMIWIAPYWGSAAVAGAQLSLVPEYIEGSVPEWYYTAERISYDLVNSFGTAAEQVLDISEPVTQTVEFYEPGVEAVWDAWLELMADPPTY